MNIEKISKQVQQFWEEHPCGVEISKKEKYTQAYFEDIEEFRYSIEPEIFSFAQFTRYHRKKVLEIGVGTGTDFIQWVRAGAHAYGVDLTENSIEHVKRRLLKYDLVAKELRIADAQLLPHADSFFDLTYAWGVIHHAPDPMACVREIVRVTKPAGHIKLMVYNRRSLYAFYLYLKYGLLKGKPFRSLKSIIYRHQESIGTQAYTYEEIEKALKKFPVKILSIRSPITQHDLLYYKSKPVRWLARKLAALAGWEKVGWFMMIDMQKL